MTEKQQSNNEIKYEVNLQFIKKVREDIYKNPKTLGVVIAPRIDDTSVFTAIEDENVLLSFSS